MITAALTPNGDTKMTAVVWMENYFALAADKAPNRLQSYLSECSKLDVHRSYTADMEKRGEKYVDFSTFTNLWNTIYPYVKLRSWVNVMGKCDTCAEIDAQRRQSKNVEQLRALKLLHILHRGGMFMLERKKSVNCVYLAVYKVFTSYC